MGSRWLATYLGFDFHLQDGSNYRHEVADGDQDVPSVDELPLVSVTYAPLVLLQEEV